jgi:hypothetical protein
MKAYKINYHSIIDVITNSSSELFISTNGKIIDFIKSVLSDDKLKNEKNVFYIQKFKDFYNDNDLDDLKEHNHDNYVKTYGNLKDDDEILICNYNTDEIESIISGFLDKLGFISLY